VGGLAAEKATIGSSRSPERLKGKKKKKGNKAVRNLAKIGPNDKKQNSRSSKVNEEP